jgi:hypothetical protein
MATTNNATYNSTSTLIGKTTTDINGWYSFTVTPTSTGTYYYYLFDAQAPAGTEWTYARSLTVTSLADALAPLQGSIQTLTIVAGIALVLSVVLGGVGIYMARKKPT